MDTINLFNYMSYSEYLKTRLGDKTVRTGLKTKLATLLDVKNSFVSRVLKEQSHLTLEQAYEASDFLELSNLEKEYFIKLVLYARAGNHKLKSFHKDELLKIQKESLQIEKRIDNKNVLTKSEATKYYGRWIYLAVHIAVSIPKYQTVKALSTQFDLTQEELNEILEFLTESKVIQYDSTSKKYSVGNTYTHIDSESDLIFNHHYNWRIKSLETIAKNPKKGLHYSGVFSLSKADAEILKDSFLKLINNHLETIKPSKEEVMYCQVIDFFEVT